MELSHEEFWWNSITGPRMFVHKVADTLLDSKSVVMILPDDLSWMYSMRGAVHSAFRERAGSSSIIIETIDSVDDNPGGLTPGRLILSRFALPAVSSGYREKSRVSIQDYISTKNVIKNRVIWVKGLTSQTASQWIKFCREFGKRSLSEGLFVLEVQGRVKANDARNMECIDFSSYVSSYDVRLFNSFILDGMKKYNATWKEYIASAAAVLCGYDAEVSALLLETVDFKTHSPLLGITRIASLPEYESRGESPDSDHALRHCRDHHDSILLRRLWNAQVQVLFPVIELERARLIDEWRDVIEASLEAHDVMQYGEVVSDASDLELGTLSYMMSCKDDEGRYLLFLPEDVRERICFLHECRNLLAHASCCSVEQIVKLLGD